MKTQWGLQCLTLGGVLSGDPVQLVFPGSLETTQTMEENMDNKLKIALKCTKYLLMAVLISLLFVEPEKTEAKAEAGKHTYVTLPTSLCPTRKRGYCNYVPGQCSTQGNIGCEMDEIVIYG